MRAVRAVDCAERPLEIKVFLSLFQEVGIRDLFKNVIREETDEQ